METIQDHERKLSSAAVGISDSQLSSPVLALVIKSSVGFQSF